MAALRSPWDLIATCLRKCGLLFMSSLSSMVSSTLMRLPKSSGFISTSFDFALTGESFDCQTSLQVMMIGKFEIAIARTNSGMPPMSVPVTPSTSSMRIIFPFLKRDFCWVAGLSISSSFARFRKSEELSFKDLKIVFICCC